MPDGRGGYGSEKRGKIIQACEKHWPENADNCSGFVKAVAEELGVTLSGQANDIYEQISAAPWGVLGEGTHGASLAGLVAQEGRLVVAAKKASQNGHVAIVVDLFGQYRDSVQRGKAVAYWGRLHSVGKQYTQITKSWNEADLQNVKYAYIDIP